MSLPDYQITCANKNQNGTIIRVGGQGWSLSHHEAIQKILTNQITMHILVGNQLFLLSVQGKGSDAHLVLEPDGMLLSDVKQLISC